MKLFVQKQFAPLLKDANGVMRSLSKYMDCVQPLIQLFAFLYHLRKDRHVHLIHKIHELLSDKVVNRDFKDGVHKLMVSILAALLTQSDQVIKMFPVLTGLGKIDKQGNIYYNPYNCRDGDSKADKDLQMG